MRFLKTDLFSPLTFLYFFTLHADKLSLIIGGYTFRINNLIAFLLAILLLVRFRERLLSVNKQLAYPLLFVTLSLILSALYSPYKQRCLFYLGWYGVTLLCYVLLPYLLIRVWDLYKVFALYCLSFICVGCYAAVQLLLSLLGFHDPFVDQYIHGSVVRPNALCFEPSYYALYMTPFISMYNAYFLTKGDGPFFIFRKKSSIQACLINLLYVLSTSTAVLFAYLVFMGLAFFFRIIDRKRLMHFILTFFGSACTLLLAFPFVAKNLFMKFFFYGLIGHHSFFERWIGLINGWKIFLRYPVLGVGLGGYPSYLMEAYLKKDRDFTFLNMHDLIGEFYNPIKLFDAMNVTTELLASVGVVGCCAFGWLFVLCFLKFKQARDRCDTLSILFISIIVTLVVLQFSQGLFRTYIWTHFTLAYAYFKLGSESLHEPTSSYNYFS